MDQRWLRMPDACKYAGLSRKTLKKLVLAGEIRSGRTGNSPGSHYRIDRESIDSYFSQTDDKALAILRSMDL